MARANDYDLRGFVPSEMTGGSTAAEVKKSSRNKAGQDYFSKYASNIETKIYSRSKAQLGLAPWDIRVTMIPRDNRMRNEGPLLPAGRFHRPGKGMSQRVRARQRAIDQRDKESKKKHALKSVGHTLDKKQNERTDLKKKVTNRG